MIIGNIFLVVFKFVISYFGMLLVIVVIIIFFVNNINKIGMVWDSFYRIELDKIKCGICFICILLIVLLILWSKKIL